jgi:RNA polymerase sigma-70 factor (ECF subfamily)
MLLRRRTLSPEDVIDELLRRAGQGDEAAFARLYDVMIPLVLCVARLLTGPDEAEALAERACVDVWRMSPGYPGSKVGPLSWIAGLVEHAAS